MKSRSRSPDDEIAKLLPEAASQFSDPSSTDVTLPFDQTRSGFLKEWRSVELRWAAGFADTDRLGSVASGADVG